MTPNPLKEQYRAEDWGSTDDAREAATTRQLELSYMGFYAGVMSAYELASDDPEREGTMTYTVWGYHYPEQTVVVKPGGDE